MLIETSTGKKKVINGQTYYFADIYRYLKDKLSEIMFFSGILAFTYI